jgi:glycosyltransferase involved in cell wall biosynthesis
VRIGVLTTSYPRFSGDYAGCFVADRVRALLAAGHEVEVLAAGHEVDGPAAGDEVDALAEGRLRIERIPADVSGAAPLFYGTGAPEALERGDVRAYLAAARFLVSLTARAAERARASRWDAVEAHWLVPSALAALAAVPNLSLTAFAHSGDVALLERLPLGDAIARRLAGSGAELRFVTAALRDRFARLAGRFVGLVEPLGAPADLFAPRGAAPDPDARRALALAGTTILAVGRLVPIKGHAMLLRACARLRRSTSTGGRPTSQPSVVVVILGDGPERPRLVRLAAALGVPVRLPGFVPRDEVVRWLRAADVFVQPSIRLANGRTEGAPVALAEARAVGTPVVVAADPVELEHRLRVVTGV